MGNILLNFACKNFEIYLREQRFISISKKPTKIAYMIETWNSTTNLWMSGSRIQWVSNAIPENRP